MVVRDFALIIVLVVVWTGCSPSEQLTEVPTTAPAQGSQTIPPGATRPTDPPTSNASVLAPICDPLVWREAPDDWYRDEPVYRDLQYLKLEVGVYAATLEGFEAVWTNRARHNWIHVGFVDTNILERQRDLEVAFPGEGIVAVELDYSAAELNALAVEVADRLPEGMATYQTDERTGTISIWVGKVTDENRTALGPLSGEYPLCVAGLIGDQIGEAGPQQLTGDGWRYLAETGQSIGHTPRIITNSDTLQDLWTELRLETPVPEPDWETEIVVAFEIGLGGGSCDESRFDGIVAEEGLLQAVVVDPKLLEGPPQGVCLTVYRPYVYVVTVERGLLPAPPFTVKSVHNDTWDAIVEEDLR